jgi:hypothetical protein
MIDGLHSAERGREAAGHAKILIATHHKVGTVLMQDIFTEIARRSGRTFRNCAIEPAAPNLEGIDFAFDWHSKFHGVDFDKITNFRGVHLVRDPRLVVVSAAFYHARSVEAWLHKPLEALGGLTYQQKLLSLPTFRERLKFEMMVTPFVENAGSAIRDMVEWRRMAYDWCKDIQLEVLMTDINMTHWRELFSHLGFEGQSLDDAISIAYANSVFNPNFRSTHVRSRLVEKWHRYFDDELAAAFRQLFATAVEELGYTWDDSTLEENADGEL